LRRVALAALLVACAPDPGPAASWVEPMDGATGWLDAAPLRVVTPTLDVPPDYELEPSLRVVDLADGGYVAGTFAAEADGASFTPDEPWQPNRRYAWTLDVPSSLPHGPEWSVPEVLPGTAVFDTDPAIEVLGASTDDGGRVCVVLSAMAPAETVDVEWTLNDMGPPVPDTLTVLPVDEWAGEMLEWGLHPAIDVACLSLVFVSPGDRFRFWVGDSGPYLAEISEEPLGELVAARYRFATPDDDDEGDEALPDEEAP